MDKVAELKTQLNNYLINLLNEVHFRNNLKTVVVEEFKHTLLSKKAEMFQGEGYRIARNSIKISLYKAMKTQSFKGQLNSIIDAGLKSLESSNQSLESVIPPAVANGMKVYIYNHKDELVKTLKSFLNSEDIDKKIQKEINSTLGSISPMASRFVNPGNIFARFKSSINDYLDNSKNIMAIITLINNQLDEFMKKKISDFTSYFPAESRDALVNSISKGIMDKVLSEKFLNMAIDRVEELLLNALETIDENKENSLSSFSNVLNNFIDGLYEKLMESNKFKELVELVSDSIVDNLLNKPLITFLDT